MYQDDEEQPYDQRDENYESSEDETSHYCEVCDREFFTAELLERHEETHTTCGIDGCIFSAHPKLVEKHISMQHCTGLYHRMKNLSTPEDIQKWIAERKKKYPTKSNIEHKKAEETEKIERGEIIQAKQSGSKHSDKPVREKRRKVRKRKFQNSKAKPEPTVELYRGLRPFAGTANLPQVTNEEEVEVDPHEKTECISPVMDLECNISDEEEPPILNQQLTLNCEITRDPEPVIAANCSSEKPSRLGSLVADYGSDSSDDEGPVETPIKRIKPDSPVEENAQKLPSSSIAESSDKSQTNTSTICKAKPESVKNPKSTNDRRKDHSTGEKSRKNSRENVADFSNSRNSKRLMLLQRLLSRSMQHERNLICQCIKHIADNNFLQ